MKTPPLTRFTFSFLLVSGAASFLAHGQSSALPDITEFMASNDTTLKDGNGNHSDWIEIHNPGPGSVNLENWALTDSAAEPHKWTFPSRVLPAGGYVVVFASGDDEADPAGNPHTNFKLSASGEYLALVHPDGTPVREFSPAYPAQTADVSWGSPDGVTYGPYAEATPGAANGFFDSVATAIAVSPPGGTFTTSVTVSLAAELPPNAVIRYTLTGAAPTAASPLYTAPLTITANSRLRARVFLAGLNPGPEAAAVYLKLGTGMTGFSSNLPVILLDSDTAIAGAESTTLTGSNTVIIDTAADTLRADLTGSPSYSGRSGLRLRGRSSQSFPQKQYKIEVWDAANREIDVPLLGLPAGSDWVLSAVYTDKSLIRNALAFQTWADLNRPSLRHRFVEVFLNSDGDAQFTYADDYVGVYLLVESIKLERAGLEEPEDTTDAAGITGGFIIETGNADTQDFSTGASGRAVAHSYRDPGKDKLTTVQRNWARDRITRFEQALYGANFKHPVTGSGYREYTDSPSQVDYRILREWSRNFDGGSTNSYFPNNGGKLTMGPLWDYNWAFGNINYAEGGDIPAYRTDGWNRSFTANVNGWAPWWLRLEQDPDWWQEFIDQWGRLRQGLLADNAVNARITAMTTPLAAEAAARHFAKWPQLGQFTVISAPGYETRTTYQSEVDYLKTWLSARSKWMDSRFPAMPKFSPAPGGVSTGTPVSITGDAGETVYYTTDGSDPRLPGGGISPAAVNPAGAAVTLTSSQSFFARARRGAVWGAPRRAGYPVGPPAGASTLVLTEIHYHPADPTAAELSADASLKDDDFEFLELRNVSAGALDLTGAWFANGITFAFPARPTALPAGATVVLAKNPAAHALRYPAAPAPAGAYQGSLDNSGETLTLLGADGSVIFDFRYRDGWSPVTDGGGYSLNLRTAEAVPAEYGLPAPWSAGHPSPGVVDGAALVSDFVLWQRIHFPDSLQRDFRISGPDGDPDQDGTGNFLEFALLRDPLDPGSRPDLSVKRQDDFLTIQFKRPARALGLDYQVESSVDLIHWETADVSPSVTPEADPMEETVSFSLPAPAAGRRWHRVRVTAP